MKGKRRAQQYFACRPMGHMGKQSLFRKYFMICSVTVIASITILGVVLLSFCSKFFERERYEALDKNIQVAATAITRYNSSPMGPTVALFILSNSSLDADFFLTDLEGNVMLTQVEEGEGFGGNGVVSERIINAILSGVPYEETGMLDGFYESPRYTVAVPIYVDSKPAAVLFATSEADDLFAFLREITKMFLFSAIMVLALASIFISFITGRMVRPLNQMLHAIQSFSQGDFSRRVPVSGYDEIGQLSMAFNNMASTLASTESSRRSFIANVSHELKTPMTTIGGFVDGILDGTVPEEKRNQYLQVVSVEVKRLSRLVRSMLDTARIEAGELQIHPVDFDISEIIRQTIFTFEQNIEEKQLEIRGLEADKVFVNADPDLMHQVVYNLVENAVKFVNQEGYIEFRYRTEANMTFVAIRNSGEGLNKEEAPQLFDRFYKSDKSRSVNKSGVGLGLHIVRTIINYHKGEIVVRSSEGEYTEFEFAVPGALHPPGKKERQ